MGDRAALAASFAARFRERVTEKVARDLRARGYAVVDDFLRAEDANDFRAALEALASARVTSDASAGDAPRAYLRANRTKFGANHVFSKPNVYECDMHDDDALGATRAEARFGTLWAFFEATEEGMADAFAALAPELRLRRGSMARTVKLQVNEGRGACFPWHYDNPAPPSNRALTCILYLNPDWKPGDGGELRFQPFCGVGATVAPRHNRLAVFYSDRTLHRVAPFHGDRRYAVTVWLDGDFVDEATGASTNVTEVNVSVREALEDVERTAKMLAEGNAQRALSRAVYADEYEASLVECMGTARGVEEMLESHYEHCRAVKKNEGLKTLVDALRDYRREVEAREKETFVM